jgi:hypothetical protein
MGALLTTREGGRDLLTMEGWELVAVIDGDGDPVTGGAAEVWRRVIGGRTEWCDYCALGPQAGLPPEQCWSRQTYPFDPRLIEY